MPLCCCSRQRWRKTPGPAVPALTGTRVPTGALVEAPTATDDVIICGIRQSAGHQHRGGSKNRGSTERCYTHHRKHRQPCSQRWQGNIAFYNAGTVDNGGQLLIGNLSDVGPYGLLNDATFNNNTGGQITIDNTSTYGLYNAGGTFTNAATITIGAIAGVGISGLRTLPLSTTTQVGKSQLTAQQVLACRMQGAASPMPPPSPLEVRQVLETLAFGTMPRSTTTRAGKSNLTIHPLTACDNAGGTFTNAATITIGAVASVGPYGLLNLPLSTTTQVGKSQLTAQQVLACRIRWQLHQCRHHHHWRCGKCWRLWPSERCHVSTTRRAGKSNLTIHPLTACTMQVAPSPMRPPSLSVL